MQARPKEQSFLVFGLAAIASAAAGWSGVAEGAWCSPLWPCVITYFPGSLFAGLLFAGPAIVAAVILVALTVLVLKIRISPASLLTMMVLMWLAGFALGLSPGTRGQGP
jgi:hypothetical protein